MELEYKPNSADVVADTLFRAPVESNATVVQLSQGTAITEDKLARCLQHVQAEQRKDKDLVMIIELLTNQTVPMDTWEAKVVLNMATKGYMVVDGILYYEGEEVHGRQCLVVSVYLRQKILGEHHEFAIFREFCWEENIT